MSESETLRDVLPEPTRNQDILSRHEGKMSEEAAGIIEGLFDKEIAKHVDNDELTRNNPDVAYEVAHAIKPEIEAIMPLEKKLVDPDDLKDKAKVMFKLKAVRADLERNTKNVLDHLEEHGLGKIAVEKS